MAILKKGLVQIYTGEGKGKTTAALGLAWRMLGTGGRVYICQFLKPADRKTGEAALAQQLAGNLTFERLDQKWDMKTFLSDADQVRTMQQAIARKLMQIKTLVQQGSFDLVILDELIFCLKANLAGWDEVRSIIHSRAESVELVLTGSGADSNLIQLADLVTEMKEIKHPFRLGQSARPGIEY
jgi:cob(I)alamin adenosyltransferase